jgi:hypothetical protein
MYPWFHLSTAARAHLPLSTHFGHGKVNCAKFAHHLHSAQRAYTCNLSISGVFAMVSRWANYYVHQNCAVYPGQQFHFHSSLLSPCVCQTPEHGVSLDNAQAIRTPVAKGNMWDTNATNLAWFMTMIEFGKSVIHQWPADCQGWIILG